jgi:hypothetical protein
MKALSLIALFFAVFLIFLGYTSRDTAGDVLGTAVMTGGVIITLVVAVIRAVIFFKEKKEKERGAKDPDSEP